MSTKPCPSHPPEGVFVPPAPQLTADVIPEIQLLLCCAQARLDQATVKRINAIVTNHSIDWKVLVEMATHHEVKPLLYRSLNTACPNAVPSPILRDLQIYFQANAIHNLLLAKKLLTLLHLFESHGILVIPFKGPTLAVSAYGDLSLRQFGDLDLLVQEQDFLKAKHLLMSQGYYMLKDVEHEQIYLQAQLFHEQDEIGIDLHYGIPPKSLNLDPTEWWQRLEPVSLLGKTVLTLAPIDCLLVVCVNASKENWASLSKICDVAELVRTHQTLHWGALMRQTSKQSAERPVYSSLLLASRLLGQPRRRLLLWKFFCWPIACLAIAPTFKDQWFFPLPRFLHVFYYAIRPIRLTGTLSLAMWQIMMQKTSRASD